MAFVLPSAGKLIFPTVQIPLYPLHIITQVSSYPCHAISEEGPTGFPHFYSVLFYLLTLIFIGQIACVVVSFFLIACIFPQQ